MKRTLILVALILAFSPIAQAASDSNSESISFIGSWGMPEDTSEEGETTDVKKRHPFKDDKFNLDMTKFDADGDGTLSEAERQAMHEARKTEMEAKMLEKFDTDGDGTLSDTEKTAMEAARPARGERKGPRGGQDMSERQIPAEILTKFDTDGDGTLSDTEKQAMHEARKTEMKAKMLEKFDTDGDGTLSDTEKTAMEAARPARGERKGPRGKPGMRNRR